MWKFRQRHRRAPYAALLLFALAFGEVACGCHGLNESPEIPALSPQPNVEEIGCDHEAFPDEHPVEQRDCECSGACCEMFALRKRVENDLSGRERQSLSEGFIAVISVERFAPCFFRSEIPRDPFSDLSVRTGREICLHAQSFLI